MDQFIQYLYEYEHGERVRNLGFMKVENKMDKVEIQIYAKQLDEISGIYFKRQDGTPYIATWEVPEFCQDLQMTEEPRTCSELKMEEIEQPQEVQEPVSQKTLFWIILLGGVLLAAGIVAAVLLGKKKAL